MRKINFLEWVRGIAALLVCLHHSLSRFASWSEFSRQWIDFGRVGVVAFFLVSGYVITLSLGKQNIRTFFIRRFFRLYPVYLLILTIYIIINFNQYTWTSPNWYLVLFLNATMLQELVGLSAVLAPAWTLSIEWVFYTQQAVAKKVDRLSKSWITIYLWLAIYLIFCTIERISGMNLPKSLPMLIAVAGLGNAWFAFHSSVINRQSFLWAYTATTTVIPLGYVIGLSDELWSTKNSTISFLIGIGLFGFAATIRANFSSSTLVWFGGISYALYLIEPVISELVSRITSANDVTQIFLIFTITISSAWVIHKFIELPCTAFARQLATTDRINMRPKETNLIK